jgi:N-acetyl-1-D-myo-inositol-2-amino-2-deoxy-alpha-D-glucopyranoside deacetylase
VSDKTLLAIFAHPDDEAFGTGGTLAHYATEGVRVVLVCATRGEAGEISDPALATAENLGTVRETELKCAAQMLGISEVIFLGYRDSGMADTPSNDDIRAYVNVPANEVVRRLVGIIRDLKPTIVVTFEPSGGYGHPDHTAIHRHTVAAFHAAANPDRYPDQGPAWQAQRLFYTALPHSFFQEILSKMKELGVDTSEYERFDEDFAGWPDEQIHCVLDIGPAVDAKWEALECHRTQFGPNNLFRRLPVDVIKETLRKEHFALAWPKAKAGFKLGDLFEGIETKK